MRYIDLDLNLIKVFLTVYECKSILRASQKLFVSQPAITKSIKRLEQFLGGKLFIRTPKGVIPTTEGEQFNSACFNSMKILENGINKFSDLANLESGTLNIGSSSTIIRKILMVFINEYSQKFPKIKITVTDANSEKLLKYLKNGAIDLAILNMPIPNDENFVVTPLIQTHDCFISSTKYKKQYLTIQQLQKEKLILQKRPSSNRDYFEKMREYNNINLTPSYEIGSFGLITDFVSQNMGIAYTIKEFVQTEIDQGKIKILDTNFVSLPRDISIITLKTSTNSFACNKFIDLLKKYKTTSKN